MRRSFSIVSVIVTTFAFVSSCASSRQQLIDQLQAYDPQRRIHAISEVVRQNRRELRPQLVDRLDDEDSAVRMFSILALEKFEGTRLGYHYGDPPTRRCESIEKWKQYLAQQTRLDDANAVIASENSNMPEPDAPVK